jgi:hypothetical protein
MTQLPYVLRSIANDFGISGPQYATLSSVLRQAADALEHRNEGLRLAIAYCEGLKIFMVKDGRVDQMQLELDRTIDTLRAILPEGHSHAPRPEPSAPVPADPDLPDDAGDQCDVYRHQLRPCPNCEED